MDIGITEAAWREVDKPSIHIYVYMCVCQSSSGQGCQTAETVSPLFTLHHTDRVSPEKEGFYLATTHILYLYPY
jgi:hypothetical protein